MSEVFDSGWEEFTRRCAPRNDVCVKVLQDEYGSSLAKATSLLDFGPGEGKFTSLFITELMPNLTHYYAVDISEKLSKKLHDSLDGIKNLNFQVDIKNIDFKNYPGPPEPVDVVLLAQVIYYFDDVREMIEQLLKYVKPNGKIVIIDHASNSPNMSVIRQLDSNLPMDFYAAPVLSDMGLTYKEHRASYPFDMTREGFEGCMWINMGREPTKQETEKYLTAIDPHTRWQDGKLYVDLLLRIIVVCNVQ